MTIKIKNFMAFICYPAKEPASWWTFTLFGLSYNCYCFEIRPFHWEFGLNQVVYGHHVLGPFHIWTGE